jgi:hypothetical protein
VDSSHEDIIAAYAGGASALIAYRPEHRQNQSRLSSNPAHLFAFSASILGCTRASDGQNLAPFWTQPTSGLLHLMRKKQYGATPLLTEELAEMEAELDAAVRKLAASRL